MSAKPTIDSIFCSAIEIELPDERRALVEQACGEDVDLRQQVERLLQAHFHGRSILDTPVQSAATIAEPLTETTGTVIGPYKLLEQIGEGGMGAVWLAQQTEPVKRLVALKLIKAGLDSRPVIARFEAERQALALMDHPNIARVLDAGTTTTGRPYFVMELVKGEPLTRYCDKHRLTPKSRLELFIPVCQAIQHAHQKGIIHRDIKPSNVLVALYDGKPVPRVIDFGVAKAAGQSLTDKTLVTGFGNIVGTLEYMSPEQAEINQLDIDTRSDIYSLGVLLYELLAGSPPFSRKDLEKAGMLEMLRVIREKEPPAPSTKLSTAESLPTLAANRSTEPAKLTKLVRGELDWIVMKALEKDRNRRYATASAFALDVERYLRDEPVEACPPSAWYRFRKFARRNQVALTVTALVAVVLSLATAISAWQAIRATEAEGLAEDRFEQEKQAKQAAETAHAESDREKAEKGKALVRVSQEKVRADQNLAQASKAVKDYLTKVAGDRLLHEADFTNLRRELLESALPFYLDFVKQKQDDPALEQERGVAYGDLGTLRMDLGERDQALADFDQQRAIFERLAADYPKKLAFRQQLAQAYRNIGLAHEKAKQSAKAELAFRQALTLMEPLWAKYPAIPAYRLDLACLYDSLSVVLLSLGRLEEALGVQQKGIDLSRKLAFEFRRNPDYWHYLAGHHANLGQLLRALNRCGDALASLQESENICRKLAEGFPNRPEYREVWATGLNNRSILLCELGRHEEGLAAQEQSLAIQEKLAADFPSLPHYRLDLARSYLNLNPILIDLNRYQDALTASDKAVELLDRLVPLAPPTFPEYRHSLALALINRGQALRTLGQNAEAIGAFKKALGLLEKLADDFLSILLYSRDLGLCYVNLGELLTFLGRHEEAGAVIDKALPLREKLARDFPANRSYLVDLAGCYIVKGILVRDRGEPKAALDWFTRTLAKLAPVLAEEKRLAEARRFVRNAYLNRARTLVELARFGEALEDLGQALKFDDGSTADAIQAMHAATEALLKAQVPPHTPQGGNIFTGTLTKDDPTDTFPPTRKSHHKVHNVPLEAGQPYLIDLKGSFNTLLRVEDSQKKPLLFNDDVRPLDDRNSRLVFTPTQKDTYRIVVTSFQAGVTGSYVLSIQKAVKVGKPTLVEDRLLRRDYKDQGRSYKTYKLTLIGGSPYTIELESLAFETHLGLFDSAEQVQAANAGIAPDNLQMSRIDYTPKVDATFIIVVTSRAEAATGAFRLKIQRYQAVQGKK
jgi:serine/threonine protein kinase/tetratricopeptide (TPR) repeat protein